MTGKIHISILLTILGTMVLAGCNRGPSLAGANRIRFEHVALNVNNPTEVAHWYRENLGMEIVRGANDPDSGKFVADKEGNMMFEFYHSDAAKVLDFPSMHCHELHIAFFVDDVEAICKKLVNAGGRMDGEIFTTDAGDVIAIVRDPWGIPLQFVNRAEPMLFFL